MAQNIVINRELSLSDIVSSDFHIQEHSFEYAGISGFAELIGYKIVFFKLHDSSIVDAISLFEIETEHEVKLCNFILQKIEFPLNFNSNIHEINNKLGTVYSTDNYLENCIRYNYKLSGSCYVSFNISNEKITGIDIVCNKKIIDNMLT